MARRRRRPGGGARIKKNQGWAISLQFNNTITAAGSPLEVVMLQDEDWVTQQDSAQRGTLKTIRGNMYASADALPVIASQPAILQSVIYLVDEDTPVSSPTLAAFYNEEDILWQHMWPFAHTMAAQSNDPMVVDIHVKVGRNLRKGQEVRMSLGVVQLVASPPTLSVNFGWNLRLLVARN